MNKIYISFICAMSLLFFAQCNSNQNEMSIKSNEATETVKPLVPFDVMNDFNDNGFTLFTRNLILCAGDSSESNAMTIGWGAIGNYLGHDRPCVTVYVAPARYTWEFMERHNKFTIMEFDNPEIWQYMGKYSGRDCEGSASGINDSVAEKDNKAAALGLHLAYTDNGAPYYEEACLVIECETMTALHQSEKDFRNETARDWYSDFKAGIHTVYIGEVKGAWKR